MDLNQIAADISSATGEPFQIDHHSSIGGGCINSAYRVEGNGQAYFIKLNRADMLDMFIAEAEGLDEMANAVAIRVPRPVCTGTSRGQSWIAMEYLEFGAGSKGVMVEFARQLAALHRHSQAQFGWHRDNTIGSTQQPNEQTTDWPDFWRQHRLGYQLELATRRGASGRMLRNGEKLMTQLDDFFTDYQPVASLLHGDLWSGNYAISAAGEPVIFDPAVYYGDREADLAMTELFGGFGGDFYAAYNEAWRLDHGYQIRKTLYNLYHILNHYNMFGGGYGSQAETMIEQLLSEVHA